MTKVPVFVSLKNATDHFMFVEFDSAHNGIDKDDLDKTVMDALPPTVPKNSVLKVICFCPRCQEDLAICLNQSFGHLAAAITNRFPLETIAKVMPFIAEESDFDSTLIEGWSFFQHLIEAIITMKPYIGKADVAAEAYQIEHANDDSDL